MQVGEVDVVGIADRERANAGGREELRRGRAKAAHADDQRVRRGEPLLRVRAELGQQDVPAVAEQVGASSMRRNDPPKRKRPACAGRFA